jgi:hypothetical protein
MKLLRWMCFFLAISLAGSGVVQAQTIADAARQERERRKAVESETSESIPVFTSVTPAPTAGSTVTPGCQARRRQSQALQGEVPGSFKT